MSGVEARSVLPEIHDRWRAKTSGALSRDDGWWELLTADQEWQRGGMSPQFHLVHRDGYVSYRLKTDWSDGDPGHVCFITDYVIVTPEAHAALWQVLLGLDLVQRIESYRIPVDDPLPHLLDNGRHVRTGLLDDGLWLRPIDVPALLSARTYAVEVEAVLRVADADRTVTVSLEGGPDGASCTETDATPDVTLGLRELGSLYLGGMRVAPMAMAGRVTADDPTVLTRLDRAFLADRAPQAGTSF